MFLFAKALASTALVLTATAGGCDVSMTPTAPTADTTTTGMSAPAPNADSKTIQVQTTAYSFGDNQGSNNATICCGVIHKEAGGTGTFDDPTTLAVPGHGGKGMQTPAGTKVYFQKYHFYGIVEDSGATPKTLTRFDIWSDGRGNPDANQCMDNLTGTSTAILNPPPGEPVGYVGPRSDANGCHTT